MGKGIVSHQQAEPSAIQCEDSGQKSTSSHSFVSDKCRRESKGRADALEESYLVERLTASDVANNQNQ